MSIRILGIEPGFASLGIARLSGAEDGLIRVEAANTITIGKASRKTWNGLHEFAQGVQLVAYEVCLRAPQACGLALGLGFALGVPVISIQPVGIKCRLVGRASASRFEVREAVSARVIDLAAGLSGVRETQRKQAADAVAVAVVGLEEILRRRTVA